MAEVGDVGEAVRDLVASNPGQLSAPEYMAIVEALQVLGPCNFLSFSTGRDVALWLRVNAGGRSVFLEHDPHWARVTQAAHPDARVHLVQYWTRVFAADTLLAHLDASLDMKDLPEEVRATPWDVVFVDGPTGWHGPDCPGRFQSIWEAAKCTSARHVFVHDCDRRVEAAMCTALLGPPLWTQPSKVGRLWHYKRVPASP